LTQYKKFPSLEGCPQGGVVSLTSTTERTTMNKPKTHYLKTHYLNAYMTIEASLIIPLVIGTYFFLIFTSFFLYNRCVITQVTYIKCYRASTFTYWEEGYGEVSYTTLALRSADLARDYIESRKDFARYPFFNLKNEKVTVFQWGLLSSDIYVKLSIEGTTQSFLRDDYQLKINSVSRITNPVSNIRAARRNEKNAGN